MILEGVLVLCAAATSVWAALLGQGFFIIVAMVATVWGIARVVKGVRYRRDPVKLIRDLQFV